MTRTCTLATAALVAVSPALHLHAKPATWEGWRGPTRDGKVHAGAAEWPDDFSGLAREWRVEVAEGYSSPIVTADSVFTVETRDKKREIARAFDRATGEQRWELAWEGSMKVPFFARKNGSWARSTPAYAGGTLYVGGMRDVLVAIDAGTGKERWRVDFAEREGTPLPAFGFVSSPLVDGEHLYVQAGGEVAKIRCADGAKVWGAMKDRRGMYGSAFSSPTMATLAGRRQLLAQTREELAGLDPASGEVLWRYKVKAFRGMNILTPTALGGRVFTSTYGGGSYMFDIAADGASLDASKAWFAKTEGYMSSPVSREGHVYFLGRDKRFHCLRAEDGAARWSSDDKFGEYASLVAAGDRALALLDGGELLMFRLSPEKFQILARKKLADSPTWAHLAVCDDELFVRELKAIAKWRWGRP